MQEVILALILAVAIEVGVPPQFVLSIAYVEHWNKSIEETVIDPEAVSKPNRNGSVDLGVMQINSFYLDEFVELHWDKAWEFDWETPYDNVYLGCRIIKWLMRHCSTYWAVAVAYNCGLSRMQSGHPPLSSTRYADRVLAVWNELTGGKAETLILYSYDEFQILVWAFAILYRVQNGVSYVNKN